MVDATVYLMSVYEISSFKGQVTMHFCRRLRSCVDDSHSLIIGTALKIDKVLINKSVEVVPVLQAFSF